MRTVIQPYAALLKELGIGIFPTQLNTLHELPTITMGPDSFDRLCHPTRSITSPLIKISHLYGSGPAYSLFLTHKGYTNTTLSREYNRLVNIATRAEKTLAKMNDPETDLEEHAMQHPVFETFPEYLSANEHNVDAVAQHEFYLGVYFSRFSDPLKALVRGAANFSGSADKFAKTSNHAAAAMAAELGAYVYDLIWLDNSIEEETVSSTSLHQKALKHWLLSINDDTNPNVTVMKLFQGYSIALSILEWESVLSFLKIIQSYDNSPTNPSTRYALRRAWIKLHQNTEDSAVEAADLMIEVAREWKDTASYSNEAPELYRIASLIK